MIQPIALLDVQFCDTILVWNSAITNRILVSSMLMWIPAHCRLPDMTAVRPYNTTHWNTVWRLCQQDEHKAQKYPQFNTGLLFACLFIRVLMQATDVQAINICTYGTCRIRRTDTQWRRIYDEISTRWNSMCDETTVNHFLWLEW